MFRRVSLLEWCELRAECDTSGERAEANGKHRVDGSMHQGLVRPPFQQLMWVCVSWQIMTVAQNTCVNPELQRPRVRWQGLAGGGIVCIRGDLFSGLWGTGVR